MANRLGTVNLTELKKSNFNTWKQDLNYLLGAYGIKYVLTRNAGSNDKVKESDHDLALFTISSSLNQNDKLYIKNCKTAYEAIEKLTALYDKEENMYTLEQVFVNLRWTSGQSAEMFINQLEEIKAKMTQVDPNITEERFVNKLLSELPVSLSQVKDKYELKIIEGEQFSFGTLIKVVVKMHSRLGDKSRDEEDKPSNLNASFFSRNNNRGRGRRGCYICGSMNHKHYQCNNNRYNQVQQRLNGDQSQIQSIGSESNQSHNQQVQTNSNQQNRTQQSNGQANGQTRNNNQIPHPTNRSDYDQTNRSTSSNQVEQVSNRFSNMSFCAIPLHNLDSSKIYLDNCCNEHISGDLSKMHNYRAFNKSLPMTSINGGYALGKGDIHVISKIGNIVYDYTLKDVLFVPNSPITIVSQIKLENKGCDVQWSTDGKYNYTSISYDNKMIIRE